MIVANKYPRKAKYLSRPTQRSHPTDLFFFDTETVGRVVNNGRKTLAHELRTWVACHTTYTDGSGWSSEWATGDSKDGFWAFFASCLPAKNTLHCYAHNIGFDLTILDIWGIIEGGHFKLRYSTIKEEGQPDKVLSFSVIDDPPTILDLTIPEIPSKATFVDTLNYWRCKLADVGDSVGTPKYPMPSADDADWEWTKYCQRDVEIIRDAVCGLIDMWRSEELGRFRNTAAGLSYEAFRHRFLSHDILVHDNADVLTLERDAYYGGMVQCRFVGQVGDFVFDREFSQRALLPFPHSTLRGVVYELDINSAYPSQMANRRYPTKLVGVDSNPSPATVLSELQTRSAVARCLIDTDRRTYPKRDGIQVRYVSGRFWTALCGAELAYAIRHGDVSRISEVAYYEDGYVLRDFVDHFWGRRSRAKNERQKAVAELYKLLLNSLYGKFGQRSGGWVYEPNSPSPQAWGCFCDTDRYTHEWREYRAVGWNTFIRKDRGETNDSCPIISAYITAYARTYLRELMTCAGEREVYYCDTDSLFVSDAGYSNLIAGGYIDPAALGKMKLVAAHEYCEFRGLKDYSTSTAMVVAGIKKTASWNVDRTATQPEFQRLRSIVAMRPHGVVYVEDVTKPIGHVHIQGKVGKDGWVIPHRIEE